ncbi:sodium/potassium-transporting ATPase subunit beta-1-like [Drosophila navojoa]|uniref:sodium/potassium-transporting ATPase subunit beta-1-like n=1 Tax=Drosophila navojoa TaxID=7232 RepID=UPI0008463118|nr:sodium/potassium-transporting ATPase subunit beta-1-like [Drosophila navojoa]
MPEDFVVPAGNYEVRKRFRHLENKRKKYEMPWSKGVLDLEHHRLFGRTALGWTRIIYFYLLLYFFILLILAVLILIFFYGSYKDSRSPQIKKSAPGISRFPKPGTIKFNPNILKDIYKYADQIDNGLSNFDALGLQKFAKCNQDKLWGYQEKSPCVIIKINKVHGFTAQTYDDVESLPKKKPAALEETVKKYPGGNKIWLTCEATKKMEFNFIPHPYFDTTNDLTYLDRVVAVQLKNIPPNEEARVTCKVWAKNIDITEKYSGHGHVKFYLQMHVK